MPHAASKRRQYSQAPPARAETSARYEPESPTTLTRRRLGLDPNCHRHGRLRRHRGFALDELRDPLRIFSHQSRRFGNQHLQLSLAFRRNRPLVVFIEELIESGLLLARHHFDFGGAVQENSLRWW